jgi:hypothetical protein
MPADPQAAHLGGEGGGKDGDAVIVDALERLVLDRVPLEQYAHGGVGAEHDVSVEPEELGYVELA